MESLKLILLSFIQGFTELLPVSSSAHILIAGSVMDISVSTTLLTSLHLGTTLAIIFFFRKKLIDIFLSRNNRVLILKILLASIPAVLIGILFEDFISETLRASWITSLSLIFWGILMICIERRENLVKVERYRDISFLKSFLIGISESIALIPGTSRSGITTLAGVVLGLEKYEAFEFSMILGIPILLGSSVWSILKIFLSGNTLSNSLGTSSPLEFSIILLVPFIFGYLSLHIVKKLKKKNWLSMFGIYRILIGIFTLLLQYRP